VEQLARLGHNDATAVPIDELDAKLLFKSPYLSTQDRLANGQRPGRTGEAAELRQRCEGFQLLYIHGSPLQNPPLHATQSIAASSPA
jgi:hypothetical protein